MKKRKLLTILIILVTCFSFIINSRADSGWDTSYSSSSSSSSSSYSSSYSSSSSSYDRDYSYSSSDHNRDYYSNYSNEGSSIEAFVYIIGIGLFWVMIEFITNILFGINDSRKAIKYYDSIFTPPMKDRYQNISIEELHKYLPKENLIDLNEKLFNKFIEVQNSWMNFDYDKLSSLCTDELFNTYKTDLEVLKIKHGQNIMNSFKAEEKKIFKIYAQNNRVIIKYFLRVSFYDYVIDTTTNEVIRGTNDRVITNNYIMTFTKNINENVNFCPNCGAKIEKLNEGNCVYCNAILINATNDYTLQAKFNINTER